MGARQRINVVISLCEMKASRGARGLHRYGHQWLRIVAILALDQLRFSGVIGDVATQVVELLLRADEVVEAILLPQAASAAKLSIDLRCCKMLPRVALGQHGLLIGERDQYMNVVWHHNEVCDVVAIAVEMQEAVVNVLRNAQVLQHALAMAIV